MAAPKPQRMSSEHRRRQLIEVAMDLFSRKGFAGTTTKEIAAAAGVSEAIIFRHFATKEEFYTAIIEYNLKSGSGQQGLAEVQACMERRDDEGLFRTIATRIVKEYRTDSRFDRLMLHASLEGHELATIYRRQFGLPIFATLCEYLDRRQRQGALRRLNSGAMIMAIAGMAQYYAVHTAVDEPEGKKFNDKETVDTFTRILMDGVRPPRRRKKK